MSISILITSSISIFAIVYPSQLVFSISFGICMGINTTFLAYPPIWVGWRVLGHKKGLLTGVAEAAYKLSPFIIGAVYTKLINPENLEGYQKNESVYFTEPVYSHVPNALIWVTCINFILGSISTLLVLEFRNKIDDSSKSKITLKRLLVHRNFWYLFFSMFIKMIFYIFLISAYKNLGLIHFNDDHFLNFVALAAFTTTAFCSILLGSFFDKFEWEKLNYSFVSFEVVLVLIGPSVLDSKILFCVWLSLAMGISAMNFVSVWLLTQRLYPQDNWVISAVAFSLIFDTVLVNYLLGEVVQIYGFPATIYSLSGFHFVSLLLAFFKDRILIKDLDDALMNKLLS